MKTPPKSALQVLRESAITNSCVPPEVVWSNFLRSGNEAWRQTTAMERDFVKQMVSYFMLESKAQNNEYAYYFYNRVFKNIIQGFLPIGEEKNG